LWIKLFWQLKDDKRTLAARVAELKERKREKDRYRLAQLRAGQFAYVYAPSDDDSTPAHYICQPCMDHSSKKSVLQEGSNWGVVHLKCPSCELEVLNRRSMTN
jgi:hypothetical protein